MTDILAYVWPSLPPWQSVSLNQNWSSFKNSGKFVKLICFLLDRRKLCDHEKGVFCTAWHHFHPTFSQATRMGVHSANQLPQLVNLNVPLTHISLRTIIGLESSQ